MFIYSWFFSFGVLDLVPILGEDTTQQNITYLFDKFSMQLKLMQVYAFEKIKYKNERFRAHLLLTASKLESEMLPLSSAHLKYNSCLPTGQRPMHVAVSFYLNPDNFVTYI